jgi:membrane protein
MVTASLFSTFLHFAPNYAITYGTMAGAIVTMLYFYFNSVLIILGAEINAALEARPGEDHSLARSGGPQNDDQANDPQR